MINTTTAICLVLDKAASVEEAVALPEQYNIYFSGGIECHYLIVDASGRSVIAFTQKYPTGLEKLFTVCWWEHRGSGISYSREIKLHL